MGLSKFRLKVGKQMGVCEKDGMMRRSSHLWGTMPGDSTTGQSGSLSLAGVAASCNLIQLPPWPMLKKTQRAITPTGSQGDSTDWNTFYVCLEVL